MQVHGLICAILVERITAIKTCNNRDGNNNNVYIELKFNLYKIIIEF